MEAEMETCLIQIETLNIQWIMRLGHNLIMMETMIGNFRLLKCQAKILVSQLAQYGMLLNKFCLSFIFLSVFFFIMNRPAWSQSCGDIFVVPMYSFAIFFAIFRKGMNIFHLNFYVRSNLIWAFEHKNIPKNKKIVKK